VPVVHICNPSYSGSRDQEDGGLKPAQAHSSRDPTLGGGKKKIIKKKKRAGGMDQGIGPEFKPQYWKINK
jgi:hypothetical protein